MGRQQQQTNTFEGGMNKDNTSEVINSKQYLDAMNVSFVSRESDDADRIGLDTTVGRSYKITNLKSDSLFLTLPDIPRDERREICFDFSSDTWDVEFNVSFQQSATITITGDQDDGLKGIADNINENHSDLLYAEVDCDCLVLKSTDWIDQISSVDVINFSGASISAGDLSLPGQSDLEVIGWARSGTEFVLFTTAKVNEKQQQNGSDANVGQIWLFDTPVSGQVSVSLNDNLKYNDRLDFALENPIDGEIVLESGCRIRLIFTDRDRELRNIDLFPDGTIKLRPSLLSIQPASRIPEIDFEGYTDGELFQGVYHYIARYKLNDGTSTNWVSPSNHVIIAEPYRYSDGEELFLPDSDPDSKYDSFYTGKYVGDVSSKGVDLVFSNMDVNFPIVEIAAVYITTENGDPSSIYTIYEGNVGGETIKISHTQNTTIYGTTYTLADIGISRRVLRGVDALTESMQRMIYANYCEGVSDIVFNQKLNTEPGGTIGVEFFNLAFDANDIETIAQDSGTSSAKFLYWRADNSDYTAPLPFGFISSFNSAIAPLDPELDSDSLGEKTHPQLGQVEHYFRSYMRFEAYRFGIVFYRKEDNSRTPVYWLGDVEIPGPSHDNTGPNDGETMVCHDGYTYPVYVRFTGIDVSSIADKISGFSIVRTDRSGRVVGSALEVYGLAQEPSNPVYPLHERIWLSPELDFDSTKRQNQNIACRRVQELSIRTLNADDRESYYETTVNGDRFISRYSLVNLMDGNLIYPSVQTGFINSIGYDLQGIDDVNFADTLMGAVLCATEPGTSFSASTPVLPFVATEPHDANTVGPRVFDGNSPVGVEVTHEYYLNYIEDTVLRSKPVNELFGGDDETALANTRYVDTGVFVPIDECSAIDYTNIDVNVLGGDTYCTSYSRYMTTRWVRSDNQDTDPDANFNTFWLFPVETTNNVGLRHVDNIGTTATLNRLSADAEFATNGLEIWDAENSKPRSITVLEAFDINKVFNRGNDIVPLTPKEALHNSCDNICFNQRVIPTNRQVYGAKENAFQQTLVNDACEFDRAYGEIKEIYTQGESGSSRITVWQEYALAYTNVNPKRLESTTGSVINIGSGVLLDDPVYITQTAGCQHKWSVTRGPNGFYWVDANRRRVFKIAGQQITDLTTGMSQYMERQLAPMQGIDAPTYYGGIHCIYDYKHDWLIITTKYDSQRISNDLDLAVDSSYEPFTLVYSEPQQAFTTFLSHAPTMFLQLVGNKLVSQSPEDTDNKIYMHLSPEAQDYMRFYGASQTPGAAPADSHVTFVVRGDPYNAIIPHSFFAAQEEPWSQLEITSNRQNNWAGAARHLRAIARIDDNSTNPNVIWKPVNGFWKGAAPIATDVYEVQSGMWLNQQTIERIKGEELYVKLKAIETDTYRDLFSMQTFYNLSRKRR